METYHFEMIVHMCNAKFASIVAQVLNVDKELSDIVKRNIQNDDQNLKIIFECNDLRKIKPAISSMYENIKLVIETLKKFDPQQ